MKEFQTVWKPIPNSSQEIAIDTRAHHTLYHGARGPGKTITQLMRFRRFVGLGYGSYWRGLILDREFKNFADVVAQGKRFFPKFEDGCEFKESPNKYNWTWPTGEELLLRHVKKVSDYENFHGHEYPFIGWNELTKHPSMDLYDKFMSVNRSSFDPEEHTPKRQQGKRWVYDTHDGKPLPPIPLHIFSTTNPHGPGHNWVKKRFISCAEPGEIVKRVIKGVFNPKTQQTEDVVIKQIAIFGSFYENPYLTPEYRASLMQSCENNPNLYRAWIEGDWSISGGGAIDDLWNEKVHVIPRMPIPVEWKIDRSFDWGSTKPFAVVWWAESNGEEFTHDNKTYCFPAGSLIAIHELYGTDELGFNRGLKLGAVDVAERINVEEKKLQSERWIYRRVQSGPADNQIRNVTDDSSDTIETNMQKKGVHWTESDKSPGSRVVGLQLFRDMLKAATDREGPGIYFMRNCEACLELIPSLPRDPDKPDDVDTESEDHLYDAVRYRVLKGSNRIATNVKVKWAS